MTKSIANIVEVWNYLGMELQPNKAQRTNSLVESYESSYLIKVKLKNMFFFVGNIFIETEATFTRRAIS